MKSQKAQAAGARKAASISKPVQALFDDLHGRIIKRAYELYVERGCREGCAEEDWLDAEREIMSHAPTVTFSSERKASL